MSGRDEDLEAQLADHGDDRPGIDDLEGDDFSALQIDDDDELDDDLEDEDDDEDDEDLEDEDDDEGDEDLDDDLEDDDEEDEDDDYPEDATEEDIDLVVALYREDAKPAALALRLDLANDLDELINQLHRVPGEAGVLGVVSVAGDFFVLARVRGKKIQVLLSDAIAANDWPIARDAADYLGADIPEDEDDSGPVGDLDILADVGVSELDLEALASDLDADSDEVVERLAKRLGYAAVFKKAAAAFDV